MKAAEQLGPLFGEPFDKRPIRDLTIPPQPSEVVDTIVSATRPFGYVYVDPPTAERLPPNVLRANRDHASVDVLGCWRMLVSDGKPKSRRSRKAVKPPHSSWRPTVLLEWTGVSSAAWRREQAIDEFAWWLFGPMPKSPKVLRVWTQDLVEMLFLLAWPGSAAFAGTGTGLGRALVSDRCDDDMEALLVEADRLQSAGDPLGVALSMWAVCLWQQGRVDRAAVALAIYEQAEHLRARWSGT